MKDSAQDSLGSYRFTIHRQLLSGDPWNLYEAHDRDMNAVVALKVFPFRRHLDLARVQREFLTLTTFIDYVRPVSLSGKGRPVLDEGRLRSAWRQFVQAVTFLHQKGFVHGDLNPSNVLVTKKARVVIVDFGLIAQEGSPQGILGGRGYSSPEQALKGGVSSASDWYSAGVMLYEALTGRRPPSDEILFEMIIGKTKAPIEVVPDIPKDLSDLCMQLLHRDPQERPTGSEVLHALGNSPSTQGGKGLEELVRELPPDTHDVAQRFIETLLGRRRKANQKLQQNWAGGLSDYRTKYTSLELQKKALDWRAD